MGTCIKAPKCVCGVCPRCRRRAQEQYRRARNRGFAPPREVCQCGTCHHCTERERLRQYHEREQAAAERGEKTPAVLKRERKTEREQQKQARIAEWRKMTERERQRPLSDRQRTEVMEILLNLLEGADVV